jgi:hypothetical protein
VHTVHKILFVGRWRRNTNMPSVDGFDDNVPQTGYGVRGRSNTRYGVVGISESDRGVYGGSYSGDAVRGESHSDPGVTGWSTGSVGVAGYSTSGDGVIGYSPGGAAHLKGEVLVDGHLKVTGTKAFMIDHPLDPANKYLYHSSVESPDMKNVYDGVVVLDNEGEAEIELPDRFGALNKDFRYQLTSIGSPGPNLHIAEEISDGVTNYSNNSSSRSNKNRNNSHFKVAGGTSGMKVSWQVTGIRQDPYAKAHPIQVEADKPDKGRGYYIYPEVYGQPAHNGISRPLFPEEEQELL